MATLAEGAYKDGVTSLLDLLDRVRTAIGARRDRIARVAALRIAETDLAAASGALVPPP